jgi:hypothetical protein
MEIEERDGGIIVRTSDIHLPRRIGEALRHAFARISSSVSWQSPRQSSNVSTALPPSPAIVIRTRSRGSQRRAPTLWAHRLEGPR